MLPLVRPQRFLRIATALAGLFCVLAASAGAEPPGFNPGPAHGSNGLNAPGGACSVVWDPDGAGPAPPLLIVASAIGGLRAWDGSSFLPFPYPGGEVLALAVFNGRLYAGGTFQSSSGPSFVARWDGSQWQPLGVGLTDPQGPNYPVLAVRSLVVLNGVLWIGGSLVLGGTTAWNSIAAWDDATLQAGIATQAPISQLFDYNGTLYAATLASAPGVWRLDSDGWTLLGTFADKNVLTLTSFNDELICGGEFTHFFTGVTMRGVARWNGSQWVPLGGGLAGQYCIVRSLATYRGHLVAAGVFSTADGATVNDIAAWDGFAWSALGGGVHIPDPSYAYLEGVNTLALYGGDLVAAGHFDAVYLGAGTTAPAADIAHWNGDAWHPFLAGINAPVRTFLTSGSSTYAGGDFAFDWGRQTIQHVFATDGTNVNPLQTLNGTNGANGSVRALLLHTFDVFSGSVLIAGGAFSWAGDYGAADVAGYAYPGWAQVGAGLNDVVYAEVNYSGSIWAAGSFTASGATALSHLARYDGSAWVNPGFHSFPALHALTVIGNQLVIGGQWGGKPYPAPSDGVSAWDGTTLSNWGYADGPVYALANLNGDLVAAGAFTTIGGVSAAGVAIRNHLTGAWSPMGVGFPIGVPYALALYNGFLYIGGSIMANASATTGHVFFWNGGGWQGLTVGGVDGPVYALTNSGYDLQIGGDFQSSSTGVQSPYWIRYNDGTLAAEPGPIASDLELGASRPSPTLGRSSVEFSLPTAGHARVAILDLAGRQVRVIADGAFAAGRHTASWDGADASGRASAPGVYFYRIEADGRALSRRVVVVR